MSLVGGGLKTEKPAVKLIQKANYNNTPWKSRKTTQ